MAQTERARAFDEREPKLTEAEALAAFAAGRAVLSLKGLPCLGSTGAIEYIAIKLALANGEAPTVLFDRHAAGALRGLIEAADQVQWDGNAMKPDAASH